MDSNLVIVGILCIYYGAILICGSAMIYCYIKLSQEPK